MLTCEYELACELLDMVAHDDEPGLERLGQPLLRVVAWHNHRHKVAGRRRGPCGGSGGTATAAPASFFSPGAAAVALMAPDG